MLNEKILALPQEPIHEKLTNIYLYQKRNFGQTKLAKGLVIIDAASDNPNYTATEITKDQELTTKKYLEYKNQTDLGGPVFELLFQEAINASAFPKTIKITPASLYDDYFNGTDFIMKIGEIKICIDITVSDSIRNLAKKKANTIKYLDQMQLCNPKYYQEAPGSTPQKLRDLPRAVIEIPIEDLAGMCDTINENGGIENTASTREYLKDSGIDYLTITETIDQLEEQAQHLQGKFLGSNPEKAERFKQMQNIILEARDAIINIKKAPAN